MPPTVFTIHEGGSTPHWRLCLDCILATDDPAYTRSCVVAVSDGPCDGCYVPDIHDPSWPGYGLATEDVLVAPPNAKVVR